MSADDEGFTDMNPPREWNSFSPRVSEQGASVVQVESSRLIPWLMLCAVMAGLSLGLSIVTLVISQTSYRELERETRMLQMQTDGMKVAMLNAKIDPYPHLEGEAP